MGRVFQVSKKLYPFVILSSANSASAFLFKGVEIVARPFSRHVFRPKIINKRIPDQTRDFDFVDDTGFDFVDGSDFDFVGA